MASGEDLEVIRSLWREYWESLQLSPKFQGFGEEIKSLPGPYAAPAGVLLLARIEGTPAGTAALRALHHRSCEAKRLYVRPQFRRMGVARALLDRLVAEARAAGYSEMYGDTLNTMASALELYRHVGFHEVGPYSPDPTPGATYLRLSL